MPTPGVGSGNVTLTFGRGLSGHTFEPVEKETLIFVLLQTSVGLVHVAGRGRVIAPNGEIVEVPIDSTK